MIHYRKVLLVFLTCLAYFSNNTEANCYEHDKGRDLIVLYDENLYKKPDKKSEILLQIKSLTKASIYIETKKVYRNKMLYIHLDKKSEAGWIDVNKTTYIPDDWIFLYTNNFSFAIPANINLVNIEYCPEKLDMIMQCSIKDINISINVIKERFNSYMQKAIDEEPILRKADGVHSYYYRYLYNGINCYYVKSEFEKGRLFSGSKYFDLYIDDKTKNIFNIRANVVRNKNYDENEIIGNKIIFSFSRSSMYINVPVLNIREKPSIKSNIVSVIKKNEPFYYINDSNVTDIIEGKSASWIQIKKLDGKSGYIFSGFLETSK